jgi:hypothetical protein
MSDAEKIRELNDAARRSLTGCRVMITSGVKALPSMSEVLAAVTLYSDFSENNDPYGEHDFGSIRIADQTVFWKFDYYDFDLEMASPDPTDPTVTVRVLTIMLAEEY